MSSNRKMDDKRNKDGTREANLGEPDRSSSRAEDLDDQYYEGFEALKAARKKRERGRRRQLFGLAHEKEPRASYVLPDDYEYKYPPDELGEEMGPNARVWRVYLDEAELNDHDMVQEWRDGIDALLVFAGLFSAVVTTFVTQTSQKLDVDYNEISASLLMELVALQRGFLNGSLAQDIPPSELTPSSPASFNTGDAWVNGLWFASLSLSLIVALAVVLIKQWIQQYVSFVSGTARERARIHHFRYLGIQRWSLPAIIGVLPFILHAALFLFFLGLVVFLQALNVTMAAVVGVLGGGSFMLYVVSNTLPLFYPQCPYRTPLVERFRPAVALGIFALRHLGFLLAHRIIPRILSVSCLSHMSRRPLSRVRRWRYGAYLTSPPQYELKTFKESEFEAALRSEDEIASHIIQWLVSSPSNPSVKLIALQAISGLRFEFTQLEQLLGKWGLMRWELLDELYTQHRATFGFRNAIDEFIHTRQFSTAERVIRASMLALGGHRISFSSVGMPVTLDLIRKYRTDTTLALTLTTYMIENVRESEEAQEDILVALCELAPTAEGYYMVWRAWFNCLFVDENTLHPALSLPDPTVIGAYRQLRPLFRALLDNPSFKTWIAVLPFVSKVLSPSVAIPTSDFDIFQNRSTLTDAALSVRVHELCTILLKGVAVECEKDPQKIVDAEEVVIVIMEGLLGLSVSHQFMESVFHETSGRLFQLPFFANDRWKTSTYESAFGLYLYPYQSGHVGSQPLTFLSPKCLLKILMSRNCTRALLQPIYLEDEKTNIHIMNNIAHFLTDASPSDDRDAMVKNIIHAILELHQPYRPEDPPEQARQWHVHMQPLVRCVLELMIAQDETGKPAASPALLGLFDTLTAQVDIFTFVCSTFFLHGNRFIRVTFTPDSEVLLSLALYHKNRRNVLDLWHDVLTWVTVQSTKVYLEEWRHQYWERTDFDRYDRMADFVHQIVNALEFGAGEFELLRFEQGYITRITTNRPVSMYVAQDTKLQNSGAPGT